MGSSAIPGVETFGLDVATVTLIPKYGPKRDPEAHRRILDATRSLLAESGPGGASMDDIAAAAQVGKQTIYRWWPSRSALVADALEEVFETESSFDRSDDPVADLVAQITDVARLMRSPMGALLRELVAEAQRDDAAADLFRTRFFDHRRRMATAAVQRARRAGLIATDLDDEDVVDLLYAPLWLRLLMGHAPLTADAVVRLANATLRALAPAPAFPTTPPADRDR